MKYKYFTDPEHGWLKVPIRELQRLGIATQISSCSYVYGDYAYLEEDCDMSLFLRAKYGKDTPFESYEDDIVNINSENGSRIRQYTPYDASLFESPDNSSRLKRQVSQIRSQTKSEIAAMINRLASVQKKLEENKQILYFDTELRAMQSDFNIIVSSLLVTRDFEKQFETQEEEIKEDLSTRKS